MLSDLSKYRSTLPTGMVTLLVSGKSALPNMTHEIAEAANIKDSRNRKNVIRSLKAIDSLFRDMKKIPDNGIAIFSGSCI